MFPNRCSVPLDAVETMAEEGDYQRIKDAAHATRNWALLAALKAHADDRAERHRKRRRLTEQ